jgi:menaquinone-dependent protoporphyrinogen IX oxidase
MMKVWILHDTKFGNGKQLAEFLGSEFPQEDEVKIGDIKEISPAMVAEDTPDVFILGGAIRMFRGAPKSKKWLKKLNKSLRKIDHRVKYGTAFLTHGLPTDKMQGWGKRYFKKLNKVSMIENVYSSLLTARVKEVEGPIIPEEMQKAKEYIHDFIQWRRN